MCLDSLESGRYITKKDLHLFKVLTRTYDAFCNEFHYQDGEIEFGKIYNANISPIYYYNTPDGTKAYLSGYHCFSTTEDAWEWATPTQVIVKVIVPKGSYIQIGIQDTGNTKFTVIVASSVRYDEIVGMK